MGYEKNISFFVIAKSPKVWIKDEKIGLVSFKNLSIIIKGKVYIL